MRKLFILFTLIVGTTCVSWAQDSTAHEKKGVISTFRQKLNNAVLGKAPSQDSIKHKLALDFINHPMDSLQRAKGNTANQKYDSIQHVFSKQNSVASTADSVSTKLNEPINNAEGFADTLQQSVGELSQRKIDNVKQHLNKPIDKLNSEVSKATSPAEQKVEDVNRRIDEKTKNVESGIQQGFDKATDGNVKSPIDLPGSEAKLPAQQTGVAGIDVSNPDGPGLNTDLPGVTVPEGSFKTLDADLNIDQLKSKANVAVPELGQVKNVQGEVGQVDSKLSELEKYENDLRGLKQADSASIDNVGKLAEDKISNLDEVKRVSEQKQLLTKQQLEYNAMMQRYQDKKLLKNEIARKSRNVVNGKIDKLTPAFKEAQDKMAKAKKLNSNAENFKDGKIKRENEMASKPLYERLVPGITIQVYNRDVFTIDWGLQLGYKFSNRLLAGAGGVYRMGVSEKYASWAKSAGIYGFRTYANFNIVKGFYVHGEFESLYVNSAINPQTQIEIGSQIAYNGYFGIGKRYDISKKIRGSAIILYRAEFKGDLPSMSKINLRIGFDLNTKKRTKFLKPGKN